MLGFCRVFAESPASVVCLGPAESSPSASPASRIRDFLSRSSREWQPAITSQFEFRLPSAGATTLSLGENKMRALRPIYPISTMCLFIVVGFWVQSFIGVGHVGYCSLPRGGELAPEFEWDLAAEAGSITLVKVPYIRYLNFGFNHGFSGFGEGSVVGDGGTKV